MNLPIPILPNKQESLAGYLWRLSEVNGYTDVDHMRRVYKKPFTLWKSVHRPYVGKNTEIKLIAHLVKMTGLDADDFSQSLFLDLPSKYEGDHRVDAPLLDWRTGFARICPDCLIQTGIMKREWELLPFTVCPHHNKPLLHQCPACGAEISLHADLATNCHACKIKWVDSCIDQQELPEYQAAWLLAQDQDAWLHEFGWMLLKAVRPMDIQHNGIKYYDAPAFRLNTLLESAWMLMKSGQARNDWEAIRAFRFATLSGLMLSKFHIKAALPKTLGVPKNLVSENEMKPRWARLNYLPVVIGWTLDTENLIVALGLEQLVSPLEADDNQTFQNILRTEVRSVIERLGFNPLRNEKDTRRRRYDIREVNEWIEVILPYESTEDAPELYWVDVNDPILRIFGVSIIELAMAIQAGNIDGYRRLHCGLSCLGVVYDVLKRWLISKLDEICSKPVPLSTIKQMTSLSREALLKLEDTHLLTPTQGEYKGRYYTGGSVRRFILFNQDCLIKQAENSRNLENFVFV